MRLQKVLLTLAVLFCLKHVSLIDFTNANNAVSHYRSKRLSGALRDPAKNVLADYVVSLRSRRPNWYYGDNHYCVGTVLSMWYVITSAHCAMDRRKVQHRPRTILVVASNPDRLKFTPGKSFQVPVKKIWIPLNFTLENTYDLAILRVADRMPTEKPGIASVKLPTAAPPYGKICTVIGWGRMFQGGPLAAMITYLEVELMPREDCEPLLKLFNDEMLCAGVLDNEIDQNPCAGDAGAPLLCEGNTLVGIVSYKIGCGTFTLPTIYSNIHYQLDWIESVINKAKCSNMKLSLFYLLFLSIIM